MVVIVVAVVLVFVLSRDGNREVGGVTAPFTPVPSPSTRSVTEHPTDSPTLITPLGEQTIQLELL
jgi:hypothetical protein